MPNTLYRPPAEHREPTYHIFYIWFSNIATWQLSHGDHACIDSHASSEGAALATIATWGKHTTQYNQYSYIILEDTDASTVQYNADTQEWEKVC